MGSTQSDAPAIRASDLSISLRAAPGAAPGTLVLSEDAHPTSVQMMLYGPGGVEERACEDPADLVRWIAAPGVAWFDVVGLGDKSILTGLATELGMHRLTLEDVVNVHQRPKSEGYGDRLYIVSRMPVDLDRTETEQVSLFLGPGFLATFQEYPGDCFEPVRARIRKGNGRIRDHGPDYLAYAILDAITDAFFPVLETFGERLEMMEGEALDRPTIRTLTRIRDLKKELMVVRRTLWPTREMLSMLQRDSIDIIEARTRVYFRDCYDHSVQLIDIMENYRELASGLMDVYMSSTGNRMNEIMKVLTIVATIFIPLTFIAGIYGMNFSTEKSPWNMPELAWRYGYLFCLGLMALSAAGMVYYFRRIGFIGGPANRRETDRQSISRQPGDHAAPGPSRA